MSCPDFYDSVVKKYEAGIEIKPTLLNADCSGPIEWKQVSETTDTFVFPNPGNMIFKQVYVPKHITITTTLATKSGEGFYRAPFFVGKPDSQIFGARVSAIPMKNTGSEPWSRVLTDQCMNRRYEFPEEVDWAFVKYQSGPICDNHMIAFCQTTNAEDTPYSEDCSCLINAPNYQKLPVTCLDETCNKKGYKTATLHGQDCSPAICRNLDINANVFCDGDYVAINGKPDDDSLGKDNEVKTIIVETNDWVNYVILAAVILICFIFIILFA